MHKCPNCGTANDDESLFCKKCGASLKSGGVPSSFEQQMTAFGKDMERKGKEFGERMKNMAQHVQERTDTAGRRFEHRVDYARHRAESWYDRTYGVLGPLISSFVFLIVLRFIIVLLQLSPDTVEGFQILGSSLNTYILLLFGITLLSSYTQYFAWKSKEFRLFSPLIYAFVPIVWLYVAMQILTNLSGPLNLPDLQTAATTIEQALPGIFIFVLLVGYVVLGVRLSQEQRRRY
jgi:hypothetical protein